MYGPIDWDKLAWENVVPGIKRKVVHLKGGTVVLNHLEPDNEPFPHSHPHEQVAYVIQGKMEFTLGDQVILLTPGQLLTIPPGETHQAVAKGREPCLNLDFFVPCREDYQASPSLNESGD